MFFAVYLAEGLLRGGEEDREDGGVSGVSVGVSVWVESQMKGGVYHINLKSYQQAKYHPLDLPPRRQVRNPCCCVELLRESWCVGAYSVMFGGIEFGHWCV